MNTEHAFSLASACSGMDWKLFDTAKEKIIDKMTNNHQLYSVQYKRNTQKSGEKQPEIN